MKKHALDTHACTCSDSNGMTRVYFIMLVSNTVINLICGLFLAGESWRQRHSFSQVVCCLLSTCDVNHCPVLPCPALSCPNVVKLYALPYFSKRHRISLPLISSQSHLKLCSRHPPCHFGTSSNPPASCLARRKQLLQTAGDVGKVGRGAAVP